jgi:hypothetical protein
MSTSGTSVWALKRDGVINSALRKLSVVSGGSSPASYEVTNAAEALNAMIKGFQADGMPVWAIKEFTFTTIANTDSYDIGIGKTLNTPAPLKIIQAHRIENTGSTNVPMEIKNHFDFNLLPITASAGEPINLFYQPFSSYGTISLWPKPIDANTTITIVYQRPFEDMTSATDDFDFPNYWTEALIYGLAWRLSPEYGTPIQDRTMFQKEADYFHQMALSFGTEEGSLFFSPDWSGK